MDLLTDLLRQAGLRRRLLDLRQLDESTAVQFPCDKSIGLHVVTRGTVYLHRSAGCGTTEPLALQRGDIAVMARGCTHLLATRPVLDAGQAVVGAAVWNAQAAADAPRAADAPAVISGAYQLWHRPVHPFFGAMPDWFVLRADELPKLGPVTLTVALLEDEVARRELGADTLVHGLLDVIFTYLLRELVRRQGEAGAGWSHAIADPAVRRVLALMHDDTAHPWTLESLAGRAGLSRTALAERFRTAMGDTPLNHLRQVRMQKAMLLLVETEHSLEQLAQEVGYQDAFSFSKVFKRTTGTAPRDFRRQDAAEQALAWRFKAG